MTNTNGTHLPSYSVEYYYMKHWIIMYMNVQTFLLYTLEQRQVLLCYNHKIRTIKLSMGNIHTIHIYLRRKFECWYSKYAGAFVYNPQRKCKEKFLFLFFFDSKHNFWEGNFTVSKQMFNYLSFIVDNFEMENEWFELKW